jgi:hypothetical protein
VKQVLKKKLKTMISVGDKVVCIDDEIKLGKLGFVGHAYPNWITKDTVYTVREILPNDDIVPGILLEEVVNPPLFIHLLGREQEPAFALWRFRELEYSELEAVTEEEFKEYKKW